MSRFLKIIIAINCILLITVFGMLMFHMGNKNEQKNLISENYYGEKIYLDDSDYNYASSRDEYSQASIFSKENKNMQYSMKKIAKDL